MGKCVACKGIWADRELLDTLLESAQVQSHAGTPEAGSSTGALDMFPRVLGLTRVPGVVRCTGVLRGESA